MEKTKMTPASDKGNRKIRDTHIWVAGNSTSPVNDQTACGCVATCVIRMEDATCKECQSKMKRRRERHDH